MMDKLLKVAVITWAVFLALLAGMLLTTQAAEPETFAAPVKVDRPEPSAVVGEDPDEDALITAALEAQGYFRADVPLEYELQDVLHTAAEANGVPYHVALGLIWTESRFQADADNGTSYGLCQLNRNYFQSGLTPAENIEAGMEYLGSLIERCGDLSAALCSYHDGYDTGRRGYSNAVLEAAECWKSRKEHQKWRTLQHRSWKWPAAVFWSRSITR